MTFLKLHFCECFRRALCVMSVLSLVIALGENPAMAQMPWGPLGGWNEPSTNLPSENTMAYTKNKTSTTPAPALSVPNEMVPAAAFTGAELSFVSQPGELKIPSQGSRAGNEIAMLAVKEMVDGITNRKITTQYNTWRRYVEEQLRRTTAVYSGNEVNGLGRLNWYKEIMADPLKAATDAEQFTAKLQSLMCGGPDKLTEALKLLGGKLDLETQIPPYVAFSANGTPDAALKLLETRLGEALVLQTKALAPLSKEERSYFRNANDYLTLRTAVGHTVSPRASAKQLILNIQKMDRAAMLEGFSRLMFLTDPNFLKALNEMPEPGFSAKKNLKKHVVLAKPAMNGGDVPAASDETEDAPAAEDGEEAPAEEGKVETEAVLEAPAATFEPLTLEGVSGSIVRLIETEAGTIVVGGRGDNVYELQKMKQVCAVVDLGGDDTYIEGTVDLTRPLLVLVDLAGNDTYKGSLPAIQGSSLLGISVLVDCQGDDKYTATNFAQGSTIGGAAMLVDMNGNDTYKGVRRVQGVALGGVAILLDRHGNDDYRGAMWTQGTGQTFAAGVLADCTGDDHYYSGGMYYDSYPDTPGYEGWGQGLGTGIRDVAAGGLGILLEGEGNDKYEYDYIAHGGGYWMGLGFFRDFSGNDVHQGATPVMWDGSPRREQKFQRFSTGFGCHYGAGFFFEDAGDDTYWASIMSMGFAWDCGVAFTFDFSGNDTWTAGSGNQGQGNQASLGVLVDYCGDDVYNGSSQGYASGSITYHNLPQCGGNFSMLVDYAGTDKYGSRASNNTYLYRGTAGGFLIDRPSQAEYDKIQADKAEAERVAAEKKAAAEKEAAEKKAAAEKAAAERREAAAKAAAERKAQPKPQPQQQQQQRPFSPWGW